jgi:LuxR family maltose regulon positive regulatory protein
MVLPRLINELDDLGEVALVLDDFHRLSGGVARESLAWFVDHAPPAFQLVLSTRTEPDLPLAALRAHGELLELRAGDLRFTSEEADAFLNGRLGLGLTPQDVEGLVVKTEGWPAGLYLAALSLRHAGDRHAFVRRFGGSNRHVIDFLVTEVLQAHDPPVQALMLRTSVLERLSGPLCDAVLEQQDSAAMLDALSRTNLFLVPLDDEGGWYRFHHLFAQLLRVELERRDPGLTPALHRRAYSWHRDHGTTDEAIQHAIAAGAYAEAAGLIQGQWISYANTCRYDTLLAWIRRLPEEIPAPSWKMAAGRPSLRAPGRLGGHWRAGRSARACTSGVSLTRPTGGSRNRRRWRPRARSGWLARRRWATDRGSPASGAVLTSSGCWPRRQLNSCGSTAPRGSSAWLRWRWGYRLRRAAGPGMRCR